MSTLGFCDLTISYDGVCAVKSFNDILHSGEWLCLIGPNGAGKSSVLRAVAGLVEYSGSVAIDQKELHARLLEDLGKLLRLRGTTTLHVTHDQDEAAKMADRVLDIRQLLS